MTAEHDRETRTDEDIRAERDRALAHVAALEALCADAAPVVRAVHELLVRTVAAEAARDAALAKVAEVESRESIERAAIALYEHDRGESYRNDPEFDWPNIDRAYDWDGDDDEVHPAGDWLRDRIREQARVVIRAALAAGSSGVPS